MGSLTICKRQILSWHAQHLHDSSVETSKEVSEKWDHILKELGRSPSNDTSAKNLASIVFTVSGDLPRDEVGPVMPFQAIFMGDASAHTVFSESHWDGTPLDVDVLKGKARHLCVPYI